MAVTRLASSQVKRCLVVCHTELETDSPATPPIRKMSSDASSCTTSTTSSAVITPTSLPPSSMTGAEVRL